MSAPSHITPVAEASLAERILAGDLSDLPEAYTDEEWRREAQAALDGDDRDLNRMVAEGRLRDAHSEWQSRGWNEREHDRRQFVDIEEGPLASEWFALAPMQSTIGMSHG